MPWPACSHRLPFPRTQYGATYSRPLRPRSTFRASGSSGAASPTSPYNFEAVTAIVPGATLMFPGGSTQVVPYDSNDSEYDLSESFATKAALDAAYPDGTYQVTGSGIPTLTLSLAPDSYPVDPSVHYEQRMELQRDILREPGRGRDARFQRLFRLPERLARALICR